MTTLENVNLAADCLLKATQDIAFDRWQLAHSGVQYATGVAYLDLGTQGALYLAFSPLDGHRLSEGFVYQHLREGMAQRVPGPYLERDEALELIASQIGGA